MSTEPTGTAGPGQALEKASQQQAVEKKSPAMGANGIQLTSLNEAWSFAKIAATSGLAPKGMDTPEKVFVAMQLGAELGLGPMAALRAVYVPPGGRPSLYSEAAMAIVERRGALVDKRTEYSGEGDQLTCTWHYLRAGWTAWKSSAFSIEDAKRAGLVRTDSNWMKYPKRMLLARARGFALHDDFADILLGAPLEGEPEDAVAAPASAPGEQPKAPPAPPAVKDPLLDQVIDVEATTAAAAPEPPPATATAPPEHCDGNHTEASCGAKHCWGPKQSFEDPAPMTHAEADRLIAEEDKKREAAAALQLTPPEPKPARGRR